MSEETTDAGATPGKKKSPGKILGILGMIFGLIGLICGIIAYMALPSSGDEVKTMNDAGAALGGAASLAAGAFFAYTGLVLGIIGFIVAMAKKAQSKGMVFIGLILPLVAVILLWMATPDQENFKSNNTDWDNIGNDFGDAFKDGLDDALDGDH